jgi:hypothetical protein
MVASFTGVPVALLVATAALLGSIPLTRSWPLKSGARSEQIPSMHWPAPLTSYPFQYERGPVLVTVEYSVNGPDRAAFLNSIHRLGQERKRDGAYAWGIFEDTEREERFVEAFLVESWIEHLRQHERVTAGAQAIQQSVSDLSRFKPIVTHLVSGLAPK